MSSDKPIGPALPPMFRKESDEDSDSEEGSLAQIHTFFSTDRKVTYLLIRAEKKKTQEEDDDDGFFGPALPPGFKKQQYGEGIPGPALPPGYQAQPSSSEGEDEEVIGPMPSKGPIRDSVAQDFERRARMMKEKLTGDDTPEVVSRETWMTELPPELQHIGLGARTFKKKSGPENKDRSMWTDTPADRERKERLERKEKGEEEKDSPPQVPHKDLEMAEKVSKFNETKRAESLISLHTKKMKEKAKEVADKPVERRPFDRDEDLQVNRFDEAQKQRLLKKSQELNTRFSHSKDRMFL
uniref:GPALPP motifs-containing protein 1 n=1 Tax=Scophthalmus maximus TaxID=52904 RepID=A0A8D3C8Z0_SCOMX